LGKILKMGLKFPVPGVPGRGFYINPSRRGPAVPRDGGKGPDLASPAGRGILGLPEAPEGPPGTPDPGDPRRVPRGPGPVRPHVAWSHSWPSGP